MLTKEKAKTTDLSVCIQL